MAPKRKSAADELQGKPVNAPRSLWPNYPLPKGATGWEGVVGKRKDASTHFVTFTNDDSKYFFEDEQILQWVVEAGGKAGGSSAAKPAKKAATSGGAASKGKGKAAAAADGAAGPSTAAPAAAPVAPPSPSKSASRRGKAAAGGDDGIVLTQLRDGISGILDKFTLEAMREAYEAVKGVQDRHKL